MDQSTQNRPYFFVSYVHDSGVEDGYVQRFHDDLGRDIRVHGGPRSAGFSDMQLRVGDRWSPMLVDAVSTCQVFVALCSPAYFASGPCGKEWALFAGRAGTPGARSGADGPRSAPLLPLVWVPMNPVPPVMRPYQFYEPALGPRYRERGLRDLIRLRQFEDDYKDFVTALARRMIALGSVPVPPDPRRPEFDEIRSAFQPAAAHPRPAAQREPPAPPDHPGPAHFPTDGAMPRLNPADPPRQRPPGGGSPGGGQQFRHDHSTRGEGEST